MKRVLIVDDEADYRLVMRTLFDVGGVRSCDGGQWRKKRSTSWRNLSVDLVISDIYMPVMDGIKFHRTVRCDGSLPESFHFCLCRHSMMNSRWRPLRIHALRGFSAKAVRSRRLSSGRSTCLRPKTSGENFLPEEREVD